MKIFIKKKVILRNFTSQAKDDFFSLLKEKCNNHLKYVFTEYKKEGQEENVFNIILEPQDGQAGIITVNENEMTYFLDVFNNHYYGNMMFIEYLGNGRFELILER